MNYYNELIENIDKYIKEKDYDQAKSLILNELNLAYVPRDIENKLNNYLSTIKEATYALKSLTDEDISAYLKASYEKQLIACDELGKRNLRDYIDVCNNYLKSNGFKNAKALLIDSLIRQEINYAFEYVNDSSLLTFNPSKLKVIEETDGFINAKTKLEENYMKDPSKVQMGLELLYKEALLSLPAEISEDVAENIIVYIDEAFTK